MIEGKINGNIKLTESQSAALKEFESFLDRDDEKIFVLNGAAGTGKTTLMNLMVEMTINKRQGERKISLMAPTGRAAMILSAKTGREARTIHSTIYGLEGEEFATETPKRRRKKNQENGEAVGIKLLFGLKREKFPERVNFVDESSMISNSYADNEAFKFGTGYLLNDLINSVEGQKIVFVGDASQLPPVGMDVSPALDADYLTRTYGLKCRVVTLKEVIRQALESTILVNATKLRNALDHSLFHRFELTDGKDVERTENVVETYMQEVEKRGMSNTIIISHTNAKTAGYNYDVRQKLWGTNAPRLIAGDQLIVSRNNFSAGGEVYNGTLVTVEKCDGDDEVETRIVNVPRSTHRQRIEMVGGRKVIVNEYDATPKRIDVKLNFRKVKVRIPMPNGEYEQKNYLLLDNFLDDENPQITKELASALFLDFKMRNPQLKPKTKDFTKALLRDKYFNALVCKYGYAITCHKAQGGEWESVVADMEWRGLPTSRDMFRWAYTVITRASEKFIHANEPRIIAISDLFVATPEFVGAEEMVRVSGKEELQRSECRQHELLNRLLAFLLEREQLEKVGESHYPGHDDFLIDCGNALAKLTFNYGSKNQWYVSVVTRVAGGEGDEEVNSKLQRLLGEFGRQN